MKIVGFNWDNGNLRKCQKHGVSIAEIEIALRNDPIIAPDLIHSRLEKRYIAIGRTQNNRPVYIAFTFREKDGKQLIRVVSARYMHKKEIEGYEKKATPPQSSGDDNR